jgi:hypothetical protein
LKEGAFLRLESVKYKLWDRKNHNFKDYVTSPTLCHNTDMEGVDELVM